MKFDLHFHTTFSDGMKTPEEAVKIAKEKGINFMACTDHDVINTHILELAAAAKIETLEWVELSSADYTNNAKSAHLTCYSQKFQGKIFSILDDVQKGRHAKIILQLEKLKVGGFFIEKEDFFAYWENNGSNLLNLNNGHLREYLFLNQKNIDIAKEKIGDSFSREAFISHALSKKGKFSYIGSVEELSAYEPSVEVCGQLAQENRAVLSIAHPNHTFADREEFQKLAPSYIERGVNALEIHYSSSPEWIKTILDIRQKFNLLLTFGSDCHFDNGFGKHGMIGDLNPHIDEQFASAELKKFRDFFL